MHENDRQIWLVGCIDTTTKAIIIDIILSGNSQNLELFMKNHILPGSHITHDGWFVYSFFDNEDDSVWTHERYTHGNGDFGYGQSSTSHIEQFWSQLKGIIKKSIISFPKKDKYIISERLNSGLEFLNLAFLKY